MLKPVITNPWVHAAAVVVVLALVCLLGYVLSPVLVPLFFAFLVAYVLNPVVDFFETRRIPRGLTIAVLAVLGVLLIVAIPAFLLPNLISEADRLIRAASEGVGTGTVSSRLSVLIEGLPLEAIVRYLGWVEPTAQNVDARAVLAEHIGTYIKDHAEQILRSVVPQAAGAGQWAGATAAQIFTSIGRGTIRSIMFIGDLALFAFVTAYLLRGFHSMIASARELVPPKHRARVFDVVGKIDVQVHSFLRGQMVVCVCLAALYTVGFLISGVPFAVIIGLFGGMASFVPYLGLVLTILPSSLLTMLQYGFTWNVLGVFITFAVAHAIEGAVLTPKIVGEQVGLSPVWVILAIMVFGSLLGFLGLLLAVPIAAALKVLVIEAVAYYKGSPAFRSEGDDGGSSTGGSASTGAN
jgi:predicted PurR-regulated permease PerM